MNNGIKVDFEIVDGDFYVLVYQTIWDDTGGADFLMHREKVSDKVIEHAGIYYNYHKNKIEGERFRK
ncbi:hypothetical protein PQE70_gp174 [Bacillus phage vB_BanS_Nate]|uniref:Uncharacterized protein n=1 Tax=Bacillus phage vB_BanS_Nate TaxID=2894788 RepID=A0AAE8YY75_9CAUD|nr:hypothetical protein PQE70_gp174 [Bacillus phage vB_BanS_Nate]UGO51027.1 hypothetical protein NATE_174 [Bacillus phage vB_BanS_Nate]